jgi:hypothetical protein
MLESGADFVAVQLGYVVSMEGQQKAPGSAGRPARPASAPAAPPPASGRGMGGGVDTNANAELSMRVKALEADVVALQRRAEVLTEQVGDLLKAYDDLRRRARLAY